jgi:glutamine amidotransferase PdxT
MHGYGQTRMNYAVHANIIYHFTKYVDWPEAKKSDDFIIGIVGDSPIFDELKKISVNKMAGTQRLVVKKLSASLETFDCHILFISEDESMSLKKIAKRTEGKPVLLVSESEGAASHGTCINFTIVSERLTLEINKNNIQQRKLNIASELLKLGVIVK